MATNHFYQAIEEAIEQRRVAILVTALEESAQGSADLRKVLIVDGKVVRGDLRDPQLTKFVVKEAGRAQRASLGKPSDRTRVLEGPGGLELLFEVYAEPVTLIVAGGGHIGFATAAIAHIVGLRVIVVDDRPSFATRARFPDVDDVIAAPFKDGLRKVPVHARTAAVIVTRGHLHDVEALQALVGRSAGYLGMIGSRRRVKTVMDGLLSEGITPAALRELHAPIGLDIGAETPEEIALAIVAEVLRVLRGGTGASLSLTEKFLRGAGEGDA